MVGTGHRVLDLGCGTGAISGAIRAAGNHVTGVDMSEGSIAIARERVDAAHVHDIQDVRGIAEKTGGKFDTLIFSDILEHLVEPGPVLARCRTLLVPGGRALISVPNVAAWTIRLSLLFGWWEYTDTGIMDRTHLRFYTRTTARRMIEQAGYRVARSGVTPLMVRAIWPFIKSWIGRKEPTFDPAAVLKSPAYRAYQKYVEPVETVVAGILPGLLACQCVFEALPEDAG